jgi:predicted N-formylglutamate amidohydrolase
MTYQTLTTPGWENSPFLLLCEHASALFPPGLRNHGLSDEDQVRHIAVDIGAAEVTRMLAMRLGAKAILGGYSRLVADLNRTPGYPEIVRERYDGTDVSINRGLDRAALAERTGRYYQPYHDAVAAEVAGLVQRHGKDAMAVLVHSFTPTTKLPSPENRECEIGVLWHRDRASAERLMQALRRSSPYRIGDNEPYSSEHGAGGTIAMHLEPAGVAHVMVEIRQDLIETLPGQLRMAEVLARALGEITLP